MSTSCLVSSFRRARSSQTFNSSLKRTSVEGFAGASLPPPHRILISEHRRERERFPAARRGSLHKVSIAEDRSVATERPGTRQDPGLRYPPCLCPRAGPESLSVRTDELQREPPAPGPALPLKCGDTLAQIPFWPPPLEITHLLSLVRGFARFTETSVGILTKMPEKRRR